MGGGTIKGPGVERHGLGMRFAHAPGTEVADAALAMPGARLAAMPSGVSLTLRRGGASPRGAVHDAAPARAPCHSINSVSVVLARWPRASRAVIVTSSRIG